MINPFFKNTGPYDINDLLKLISVKNQSFMNEKINDIKDLINYTSLVGAAAGSIFVFKGKFNAVLINYPSKIDKKKLFLKV